MPRMPQGDKNWNAPGVKLVFNTNLVNFLVKGEGGVFLGTFSVVFKGSRFTRKIRVFSNFLESRLLLRIHAASIF